MTHRLHFNCNFPPHLIGQVMATAGLNPNKTINT